MLTLLVVGTLVSSKMLPVTKRMFFANSGLCWSILEGVVFRSFFYF